MDLEQLNSKSGKGPQSGLGPPLCGRKKRKGKTTAKLWKNETETDKSNNFSHVRRFWAVGAKGGPGEGG